MRGSVVRKLILLLLLLFVVCGCARHYGYSNVLAHVDIAGNSVISLAVHDQRSYVKTGGKHPNFIGLQRGWFGEPYDVMTEDGRPLANNMAQAIATSLGNKGYTIRLVTVTHTDTLQEVLNKLVSPETDRALLLTVKEWKTDTKTSGRLIFDLALVVFDAKKHILIEKGISSSKEDIGTNPKNAAPNALKDKIQLLFNDPSVVAVLKSEQ
jgi:hypothetical protein